MNIHLVKNYEFEEIPQPSTNSSDPEERKLARRIRIQRRIDRHKKFDTRKFIHGSLVYYEYNNPYLVKQLINSMAILRLLELEGNEVITNVRIGSDTREVARREKESILRTKLLDKLHNEATEADGMFKEIGRKWEEIIKYKDPLDLHDSLLMVKEKCDELIKQKDDIIAMLRKEINIAETNFLADQNIQADNVSTLVSRINKQISLMHIAYWNEFRLMDGAFDTERQLFVEKSNRKWERLFNKQMNVDEAHMRNGIQETDDFLTDINETRLDHGDTCRKLKITMETECETLQRELERLKRTCAMDEIKLYFNYYYVRKRENEYFTVYAKYIFESFDIKQAMLGVQKDIVEYRTTSEDTMASLVLDLFNLRNLVLTTEKKMDHFTIVHEQQFHQIWKLNVNTCKDTLKQALHMDKILHESVLGIRWKPPLKKIRMKKEHLPSYKKAQKVLDLIYKPDIVDKLAERAGKEVKVPDKLIKLIFEKICYGSGFLIEQKLKPVLPSLSEPHENLVKIENVLDALGIYSDEELKILAQFFVPYLRCPICEQEKIEKYRYNNDTFEAVMESDVSEYDQKSITQDQLKIDDVTQITDKVKRAPTVIRRELDSESVASAVIADIKDRLTPVSSLSGMLSEHGTVVGCKFKHPTYLEFGYVFRALRDFFTTIFPEAGKRALTISERIENKSKTISRLMTKEDIKIFWNQYVKVLPRNSNQLYDALIFTLTKYNTVLQERHKLNLELRQLKKENAELKHLLKNCPVSKDNLITVKSLCSASTFTSSTSSLTDSKQEDT